MCNFADGVMRNGRGGGGAQRYFMEDLVEIFAGILLGCLKISLDICFWSRGDLRKGDI